MIYKIIGYTFYRSYRNYLKKNGTSDSPLYSAFLRITLLLFLNITVLIDLFILFFINKEHMIINRKENAIIFLLLSALVNYVVFVFGSKYKKLFETFEKESDLERKRNGRLMWGYVLFSVVISFAFYFSIGIVNKGKSDSSHLKNNHPIQRHLTSRDSLLDLK